MKLEWPEKRNLRRYQLPKLTMTEKFLAEKVKNLARVHRFWRGSLLACSKITPKIVADIL